MKRVLIYAAFERFWHWTQAVLIIFLMLTGFEIHGSYSFFGFEFAVKYHSVAAWMFIVLIATAILWHFFTGQWKQYLPTTENLKSQVAFYLLGIFRNAPHPHKKSQLSKLNPLQKLVYLGLKLLVIPVMVTTGLLYMYYRYPFRGEMFALNIEGLKWVAVLHTAGAFALTAFLIMHLYLITTGHTVASNLKAMLTGYEDLEEDSPSHSNVNGIPAPQVSEES